MFKWAKWTLGLTLACPLLMLLGMLVTPPEALAQQQTDTPLAVTRAAEAVCDKQVVVLGELPSHGEARTFQAKAQIVQHLVTQCGFDALLFEAPIYDFVGFEQAVAEGSATSTQLNKAIGRFWWTLELADWRQWLFRQAADDGLVLGGIDYQVSVTSDYARAILPGMVASSVSADRAPGCEATVARNLYWRYDADQPFDEPERARLQRCAREAANAVGPRAGHKLETPAQVMLANLASYSDRQRDASTALDRDEAMYHNVLWYTHRMPAGSKVIIWTATVHAARQQGEFQQRPLGAWMAERWGHGLAVIGFTAFAGESSMAGGPRRPLPEAPPGSLEARSVSAGNDWSLLGSADLRRMGKVPSRLLGKFTSADWSTYFDYVLVVREEVAPVFESWQ